MLSCCLLKQSFAFSDKEFNIKAKCVINATGPYTDHIRLMDKKDGKKICQPSQGVHIVLPAYYRSVYIEYWYIDGVNRINVARLRKGERQALASLSICFVPSHINSIFTVNTPILYLSCNKKFKKDVIYFNNKKKKKIMETPFIPQ